MTQEEEDAIIKAECARLGRTAPRTKADWRSLALALIAGGEGKDAPLAEEPRKRAIGRPPKLRTLGALIASHEKGVIGDKDCEKIYEDLKQEMQLDIGSPKTLRTKASKLRNQRNKYIKDEKFRAKLLSELEAMCWAALNFVATHFEPSEQGLAAVLFISEIVKVVNEYLGDDAISEAVAERILRILQSVEKEPVRNSEHF
jgi:hypothetical protein